MIEHRFRRLRRQLDEGLGGGFGLRSVHRRLAGLYGDEARWEELFDKYPGKRPATSEEVADLTMFLASVRAGYITGTIVTIDGGIASRGSII